MIRIVPLLLLLCLPLASALSANTLSCDSLPDALVSVGAACLRSTPSNAAQLETQATYGTPVRVLDREGEWLRVLTPDNYVAWVNESALAIKTPTEMEAWRHAPRLIVVAPQPLTIYADSVGQSPRTAVADATLNAIFEGHLTGGSRYVGVTLPDGRSGYLPAWAVADFDSFKSLNPDANTILTDAYACMGATYLWGGTTPKAMDCSGLTSLTFFATGLILPRNASEQALCGIELPVSRIDSFLPGDLLFFGDGSGSSRITHVAISDGGPRFIHASGRVFVASLDPDDSLYIPRKLLKAVRILNSGSGIVTVADHGWY